MGISGNTFILGILWICIASPIGGNVKDTTSKERLTDNLNSIFRECNNMYILMSDIISTK